MIKNCLAFHPGPVLPPRTDGSSLNFYQNHRDGASAERAGRVPALQEALGAEEAVDVAAFEAGHVNRSVEANGTNLEMRNED